MISSKILCLTLSSFLPARLDEFPRALRELIEIFDSDQATLHSGNTIEFFQLKDIEISASEIRRRLRSGQSVEKYLAPKVVDYIEKNRLYAPFTERVDDFDDFTRFCASQIFERKGVRVLAYDLRHLEKPSEYVLVASGTSTKHASSTAEYVVRRVKEEYGFYPYQSEGMVEGRWVVLDYGMLIVHIFYDFVRQEYRLEELWKDAKSLELVDPFLPKLEHSK